MASDHPPITLQLTNGDLFEDGDIAGPFASAGDGRKAHAVVGLKATHEIIVGCTVITEGADAGAVLHNYLVWCLVLVPLTEAFHGTPNILIAHCICIASSRLLRTMNSRALEVDGTALQERRGTRCSTKHHQNCSYYSHFHHVQRQDLSAVQLAQLSSILFCKLRMRTTIDVVEISRDRVQMA